MSYLGILGSFKHHLLGQFSSVLPFGAVIIKGELFGSSESPQNGGTHFGVRVYTRSKLNTSKSVLKL